MSKQYTREQTQKGSKQSLNRREATLMLHQ